MVEANESRLGKFVLNRTDSKTPVPIAAFVELSGGKPKVIVFTGPSGDDQGFSSAFPFTSNLGTVAVHSPCRSNDHGWSQRTDDR
jgi:hypothetical protein